MMTEKLNSPIQEEFAFSAAARPYGPGGGGKREGRLDAVRLAFQSLLHRRGVGGGKATLDSFSFRVYGLAQRSRFEENMVPQDATGTDALLARPGKLPGFDHDAFCRAMCCTDDNRFVCWKRQNAPVKSEK
jgi:hypothetical protein